MATVKSGYLEKLSGLLKRDWKKRYFVLYQDGELVYYNRAGAEQSDGRVSVRVGCKRIDYGCEVEKDAQQKSAGRVGCLFTIKTTQKTLFLLADSELDALDWVQKFNEIRYNTRPMGSYDAPVQIMNQPGRHFSNSQPGMPYPPIQSGTQFGMPYPNNQSGMPYPNSQSGMSYPSHQPVMPYPPNQSGMPNYPPNQLGMSYPPNQPGMAYPPNQPGMPVPTVTAYPGQPATYQVSPYSQYTQHSYPTQSSPFGGYGYPVYQQQQVGQSSRKSSSRRGLFAGAAGGALVGGLLGYGMGRSVGGFGDGFGSGDSDGFGSGDGDGGDGGYD